MNYIQECKRKRVEYFGQLKEEALKKCYRYEEGEKYLAPRCYDEIVKISKDEYVKCIEKILDEVNKIN